MEGQTHENCICRRVGFADQGLVKKMALVFPKGTSVPLFLMSHENLLRLDS